MDPVLKVALLLFTCKSGSFLSFSSPLSFRHGWPLQLGRPIISLINNWNKTDWLQMGGGPSIEVKSQVNVPLTSLFLTPANSLSRIFFRGFFDYIRYIILQTCTQNFFRGGWIEFLAIGLNSRGGGEYNSSDM